MVDVPINFGIEMTEITKAEYYEARKDARKLVVQKPFGYVWSQGATRMLYVTYDGKFYKGTFGDRQMESWIDTFKWDGIIQTAPQAIFHRVITRRAKPAVKQEAEAS